MASLLTNDQISERLEKLDRILTENEHIWKPQPFRSSTLEWEKDYPEIAKLLNSLELEEAHRLNNHPEELYKFFEPYLPFIPELRELCQIGAFSPVEELNLTPKLSHGIIDRKWEQILAFADKVENDCDEFIDWCAGKGYLGKLLGYHYGVPVECFEQQTKLCASGTAAADRVGAELNFHAVDIKQDRVIDLIEPDSHSVALHACGDLHRRIAQLTVSEEIESLTISPCCYHKIEAKTYEYFSQKLATESKLELKKNNINLYLQEFVTGSPQRNNKRITGQQWRLSFDSLQRDLRGVDEYLPVKSLPKSHLNKGFEGYMRLLAEIKELEIPEGMDLLPYLSIGMQRYEKASRFELIRGIFRRALEMWLVLDMAQYLYENGYTTTVGLFCDRILTPRNLMVKARLQ